MVQGLKAREARLQEALLKLDLARKQILESIDYASLIQRAFLPSDADLEQALGDHFLLWLPRDGVGGDAYWIKRLPNHVMLSVFDCTGHGVPGAFLTLIVASLFEQSFDESCLNNPARLLSRTNQAVKTALSQHAPKTLSDEGWRAASAASTGGQGCCILRGKKLHADKRTGRPARSQGRPLRRRICPRIRGSAIHQPGSRPARGGHDLSFHRRHNRPDWRPQGSAVGTPPPLADGWNST
jgi:hypothetical protein